MKFRKRNTLSEVIEEEINKWQLFLIGGKLVGHYPVAGWLQTTCSYVKRKAEGTLWEDKAGERMAAMVHEVFEEVKKENPVRG